MSKEKDNSAVVPIVYDYCHFDYLWKRQRGRRLKNGADRRRLKFERRYCILKSEFFTYMKDENAAMEERQTFSVKRIEFIEDVSEDTFSNGEIDYSRCFQFGDGKEALYFIADTVEKKKKWVSNLRRAAQAKSNKVLETYHSGAYGSLQPDEWSCCQRKGREQMGCCISKHIPNPMEERLRERPLSPAEPTPRRRGGTTDSGKGETPSSFPGACGSIVIMHMERFREYSHGMVQSLRFSSDCVLKFNGKWLLTGKRDGTVLMWEVTPNGIELASQFHPCFEVAGQVTSIDIHGQYAAVGSAVVQLVNLTDFSLNKRILVQKSMKSTMENSDKKDNILAFLGKSGKLATAQLHGNTIDIWNISSHKTLITDPCATYQLPESAKIWSLSASAERGRALISVVSLEDDKVVTLRILQLESSACRIVHTSDPFKGIPPARSECKSQWHSGSTPEVTGHTFLSNGRTIALAQESELKLFDITQATTSESDVFLQHWKATYTHEDNISCLSHSNQLLGVGLENGTLVVYSCNFDMQHLTQSHIVINDLSSKSGSVVSISFLELNGMWCVAHKNGDLNVWKESTEDQKEVQQKSALGMELYARGILTKPITVKPKTNEFVDIGCGISISLPQEVAEDEMPIEVAFTPHGPGPTELLGIPNGTLIVSPILWVCAPQGKPFKEAAIIKLPHCLDCKTQKDSDLLTIVKAEHDDVSVDEAGQFVVDFKKVDARFPPNQQYGIIRDNHFCLYCTKIRSYTVEELQRVNYCLSILKPSTFSATETQKIHCILHYDLEGCHQLVKEQRPAGYELIQRRPLQFTAGRYEAGLRIRIDSTDAARARWRISLQSDDEILLESVNYYNYRNSEKLGECSEIKANKSLLYPYTYPPRFILEVSARQVQNSEFLTLTFTGPRNPITVTIQLQVHSILHDLFHAIEGSATDIQQKVTRYFNKLMEVPHETEV